MDFGPEANKEYIWCAKLESKTKSYQWEGRDDGATEQIVLKRACLGAGAKDKERNIVEVTSFNHKQQKVEVCICSLRNGLKEDVGLSDLTILPPAIFKLVAGSGPVHLVGNHMIMEDMDDGSDDDLSDNDLDNSQMGLNEESDEDSDEDEEEEEEETAEMKQKIDAMMYGEDDENDDDDDDEEEDESDEENPPVKKRKVEQSQGGAKAKQVSNENAKPRKAQESAKKKKKPEQTPKKEEPKTPLQQKQNKTPLSAKKSPKTYTSIDELSAAIKKYPGGKPKKEEKFNNWIRSTFRVDNHEWIKQLWKSHKADMGL